jgi:hypothetical protein
MEYDINGRLGSGLFPLFQNLDLLSDGRHPVVYFLGLCLEIGRDTSQLSSVVFQLIRIMFERIDNRLQFHFHDCFTPQGMLFPEQERWGQRSSPQTAHQIVTNNALRVCSELLTVSRSQTGEAS